MMAKTAKYLTNYNNKLSTGHEVDDNFWEELDQEQEKEDTNIQIQEIKEMS